MRSCHCGQPVLDPTWDLWEALQNTHRDILLEGLGILGIYQGNTHWSLFDNPVQRCHFFPTSSIGIMQFYLKLQQLLCKCQGTDSSVCMKSKRPRVTNTIRKKKIRIGGFKLPNFRVYHRATIIKKSMMLVKKIDTWINGIEQRVQKQIHTNISQLIFGKCCKAIQWRKDSFSINGARTQIIPLHKN